MFVCACARMAPLPAHEWNASSAEVPQVLLLQKMLMLLYFLVKDLTYVFACDSEAINSFWSLSGNQKIK